MEPVEKWYKNFAWLPRRSTTSGNIIWLQYYWQVVIYMDAYGNVPKRGLRWSRIVTQQERLIEQLKYPGE